VGKASPLDYSVRAVRGAKAIQSAGTEIAELLRRTGQEENPLLCLEFFLGRGSLFPGNEPIVLLARAGGAWKEPSIFTKSYLGACILATFVASTI
jgi:hypothetical protein